MQHHAHDAPARHQRSRNVPQAASTKTDLYRAL
jgi:hypothetical protein